MMSTALWFGVAPDELNARVDGAVWARWTRLEPELSAYGGLGQLHRLTGAAKDAPLGALLRLAAVDGHDDQLAAAAMCQQLEYGARRLAGKLRDLDPEIEQLVAAELWIAVRSFPWRRRTRSYAANLILDTRCRVLQALDRGDRACVTESECVPVDPQSSGMNALLRVAAADGPGALRGPSTRQWSWQRSWPGHAPSGSSAPRTSFS